MLVRLEINIYVMTNVMTNVMSVLLGKNKKAFERFHLNTYLVAI